jgi:hypothetical protein
MRALRVGRHVRVAPGTGVISAWLGGKNDVYLKQSGCFNSERHVPLDDSTVNVEGELMRLIIKRLITIPSSTPAMQILQFSTKCAVEVWRAIRGLKQVW